MAHQRSELVWMCLVWAIFSPFPLLVEGCASEKYVQLAYTTGKLAWVVLPICHKPEPNRYQLQEKAGSSISVTDFIFGFSFESANKFQMWCVVFLGASYLSIGSRRTLLVWATHNWQMAVTLVTDDVHGIQLSLDEKDTIIPLNNFLCSAQSFY